MPYKTVKYSLINTVILLRSCTIVIQMALILFVNLYLKYDLPWFSLFFLISLELIFNITCYFYSRYKPGNDKINLFVQLLVDVIFLGFLLYFSGGATNAFVSLLLIPIAIAAVTLTKLQLAIIASSALAIYSGLLWSMPMHVMHGNMQGHFIGMWINFILSATVISLVIARMAKTITLREVTIAKYREEQLKQEKVIALGLASAQVTHDLATPLATIRLLTDELKDDFNGNQTVEELDKQVERCRDNIDNFRQMSLAIKEEQKRQLSLNNLMTQIKQHCNLNYPSADIKFSMAASISVDMKIHSDPSLIPAIINVINNAIMASKKRHKHQIEVTAQVIEQHCQLAVRDFGSGFSDKHFQELGDIPVRSEQGLGVAMFLSNASLERLGGTLSLSNHHQGGALVKITLPLLIAGQPSKLNVLAEQVT